MNINIRFDGLETAGIGFVDHIAKFRKIRKVKADIVDL